MTRLEYELVQLNNPHLRLPFYYQLRDRELKRLKELNAKELIVSRTYILLARDPEVTDALR